MYLQDVILRLQQFWAHRGCVVLYPVGTEVGAGTFNPATFLRVLGPDPWRVVYVEPSRRPKDGRYGENPMRVEMHHQIQVVLKPSPEDVQQTYLDSLRALGIRLEEHDVRFTEDDWESPTLGATGLGWQVELDGMEITQFTYFQQMGSLELDPISVEITYGTDRLAMVLQGKASFFEMNWAEGFSYADLRQEDERQWCTYEFEKADVQMHRDLFSTFEREGHRCLEEGLVIPAYWYCLKCSHTFNVLEARGAISVTERTGYIQRVRDLARRCAKAYLAAQEERRAAQEGEDG